MITITRKIAAADLASTTCACGATKKRGQTFCRRDYFRLPAGMRGDLYSLIGDGYEAAYAEALTFLKLESPALKDLAEVAKLADASDTDAATAPVDRGEKATRVRVQIPPSAS